MPRQTRKPATKRHEVRLSTPRQRFEIRKNQDGSRSIAGAAVVYNSLSEDLGQFREKIAPGAFTQSLKDNPDVCILYGHNDQTPLGRVSSGSATIEDTPTSLRFRCDLPNTTWANDLIALMERGDVRSMSFGMVVVDDTWDQIGNDVIRTVNEAMLFELSVVLMPAYLASTVDLRSCPKALRKRIKADDLEAIILADSDDDEDDDDEENEEDRSECQCECPECQEGDHEDCTGDEPCDFDDDDEERTRRAHLDLLRRRLIL